MATYYKVTNASARSKKGERGIFLTEAGKLLKPGETLYNLRRLNPQTKARDDLDIEEQNSPFKDPTVKPEKPAPAPKVNYKEIPAPPPKPKTPPVVKKPEPPPAPEPPPKPEPAPEPPPAPAPEPEPELEATEEMPSTEKPKASSGKKRGKRKKGSSDS